MHPKRFSVTSNEHHSAVALYELNTYKKDRYAQFFWFSWKFVLFLSSYRTAFLSIRKLNLLKRHYRRWYEATAKEKSVLHSTDSSKKSTEHAANSDTQIGTTDECYGLIPVTRSIYALTDTGYAPGFFQRSSSPYSIATLKPLVKDIYIPTDFKKLTFVSSFFSMNTYFHHLRIIDKYRLSLVRTIIKRRTYFFRENSLRAHLPAKYHTEYNYMIRYFFSLNSRTTAYYSRLLRRNYYEERSRASMHKTSATWRRLWKVFSPYKRRRLQNTFSPGRLTVTVPAIYYICIMLFERERFWTPRYQPAQDLYLSHGSVSFLERAVAAVYGFKIPDLKVFSLKLSKYFKKKSTKAASIQFFFERRLAFFLSTVCIIPISDAETLIHNNCVTVGGSTSCPVSAWCYVSNFDYFWITLSESVLTKLSVSAKSDIIMRFKYYNITYWYLWVFFLKSWNLVLRNQRKDFLSLLYKELFKRCKFLCKKSRKFYNRTSSYIVSTSRYLFFRTWPSKSPTIYRNLHFLRFCSHDFFNFYNTNIFLKQKDNTFKYVSWSDSKVSKRSIIYDLFSTPLTDISFNCVVQKSKSIFSAVVSNTILSCRSLSRWCTRKFLKVKFLLLLPLRRRRRRTQKYIFRFSSRYRLSLDYILKYFIYYGFLKHAFCKAFLIPQRWFSFRSIFHFFFKHLKKGLYSLLNTFLILIPKYITTFFLNTLKVNSSRFVMWKENLQHNVIRIKILLYHFSPTILDDRLSFFFDSDLARIWSSKGYSQWNDRGA